MNLCFSFVLLEWAEKLADEIQLPFRAKLLVRLFVSKAGADGEYRRCHWGDRPQPLRDPVNVAQSELKFLRTFGEEFNTHGPSNVIDAEIQKLTDSHFKSTGNCLFMADESAALRAQGMELMLDVVAENYGYCYESSQVSGDLA